MITEAKRSETMASKFNITEKQFNGTDYDTLYPKNTSQQSLLNDSVLATKLSLTGDVDVNDVLNTLTDLVIGKAQIEVSSYTGGGQTNKTLTFNHIPRLVMVYEDNSNSLFKIVTDTSNCGLYKQFIAFNPVTKAHTAMTFADIYDLNLTWNNTNKTLYWPGSDAAHAFNSNGVTYRYIAITCD